MSCALRSLLCSFVMTLGLALGLTATSNASAQSFGLDSTSDVERLWFDGEDLLVTAGRGGVKLRHRSGATREFRTPRVAVGGRGQGRDIELVALGRNMLGRLRSGVWETFPAVVPGTPAGIVLAEDGQAMAWNSFGSLLVHVSADNTVTRVQLPPRTKPIQVFASGGGFDVFVAGYEHLLMRYENGALQAHELEAHFQESGGCARPRGVVRMPDSSFMVYGNSLLCHLVPGEPRTLMTRRDLIGDDIRTIVRVAFVGGQFFIYDNRNALTRWRPGQSEGTRIAEGLRTNMPNLMWADPASDQVIFAGLSTFSLFDVPAGHAPRASDDDGAWLAEIQDESEPVDANAGEGGFSVVLPILRLGLGGVTALGDSNGGGFAFDLVGGARFLFRSGDRHPVITTEFGYSRRGGNLGTHDLTLGIGAGYFSSPFGLQLAETLVFALGSGRSGLGLRSALRVSTLADMLGVEVSHGLEFESERHELRIQFVIDIAQVIFIGATINRLRGIH